MIPLPQVEAISKVKFTLTLSITFLNQINHIIPRFPKKKLQINSTEIKCTEEKNCIKRDRRNKNRVPDNFSDRWSRNRLKYIIY